MILINVDDILFHPSMFYLSCEVVMDDSLNIKVGEGDRNMDRNMEDKEETIQSSIGMVEEETPNQTLEQE